MKFHLLTSILALGMLSSCSEKTASTSSSSSHVLKGEDFPTFIANPGTLNIVDFSATWCPPCKKLKPILAAVAEDHANTVRLGMVDVDDDNSLAEQQGVRGIPDVRFYINGKLVDQFSGAIPKERIEQLIAKHSKNLTPAETAEPDTVDEPAEENPLPPGIYKP